MSHNQRTPISGPIFMDSTLSVLQKLRGRFLFLLLTFALLFSLTSTLQAQSNTIFLQGKLVEIRLEGIKLIEKGLIYGTINSVIGSSISPATVSNDLKDLYGLGYFQDVSVNYEILEKGEIGLVFKFLEKPRIERIEIRGNSIFENKTLQEKLKVFANNMIDEKRIRKDVQMIQEEYRKKGYLRTIVDYKIRNLSPTSILLTYKIDESPQVFLTKINVTGPEFFYPLDIERLLQSSEIDCFSWANDSGVFQEEKINVDLQIITQTYLQQGFIKLKIDKPKIELVRTKDYSKIIVDLNITEGAQYFAGKVDIISQDGEKFLFEKEEMLAKLSLQTTQVYNPFKQNRDQFTIKDVYLEQGYAKAIVRVRTKINEDTKTVDVTYFVTRREKAYIGRIEIQGNYETLDRVVRRELDIHDNELYNGLKIRESQRKINRLGFFKPGTGIQFRQRGGGEENMLDYNILLDEAQTGSFNASLSYSAQSGFALVLQISKKNLFGTGRSVTFSAERQQEGGDTRYDFSMVNPYWLDTKFTNSFGLFSKTNSGDDYDIQTNGFNLGLSYPIWKNWNLSTRYSWKVESYSDITTDGEDTLDGETKSNLRSLNLGARYSTVNHPMFPSSGYEASFSVENYGGFLGGNTEYRSYNFDTRWFSSLNESETVVFMTRFRQNILQQTNPNVDIPTHKRFSIGGITTVRGHDWGEIEGPTSDSENESNYLRTQFPYQGDFSDCDNDTATDGTACSSLPTEKSDDRKYLERHSGGTLQRILNVELLFPLTREGRNIRGVIFYDAGNVWSEEKAYDLTGNSRDLGYFRSSIGTGIRLITPMGVLRFEYGMKLDQKASESPSKFDFHISGLF